MDSMRDINIGGSISKENSTCSSHSVVSCHLISPSGVNGSPISISNEAIARAAQFPTVQSKIDLILFYNLLYN